MPRTIDRDDDWEDDRDDAEWTPDEDDEDETVPCNHCGRAIYEGAEQCPYCGNYVSEEDEPRQAKPLWIVVSAVICLAVVILWIWQG